MKNSKLTIAKKNVATLSVNKAKSSKLSLSDVITVITGI